MCGVETKTEAKEDCLICGKLLVYEQAAYEAKCSGCSQIILTNCECEDGHFICDTCHSSTSMPVIFHYCANTDKRDPYVIANEIMKNPTIHMHGPENHVLIGSALLAAYRNSGGSIDIEDALTKMRQRGSQLPGSICGLWGNCGAAVSAGIFTSIITGSTPLSTDSWGLCNLMTSECLKSISEPGGPRCCKRNGFLSIVTATAFVAEHLQIQMELPEKIECTHTPRNKECIQERCPFYMGKTS
ncbi:MAG: DUF5714 domain-containing protein [Coriobacteriia bacterium]|nr:DUF5714 domain-containing protein [Coriobacteriia bacterium]